MNQTEFINLVKPEIMDVCWKYKPMFRIPSLIIAQASLESANMKSSLAYKYNNLLGRKWASNNVITSDYVIKKTQEWKVDHYITIYSKFCVYKNRNDCFRDYLWLLHNVYLDKKKTKLRYLRVLESRDFMEATEMIRLCGYATSPTYTENLRKIILKYQLFEEDMDLS